MESARSARWRCRARRLGVSAFVTAHLTVTAVWVFPPSPLRAWFMPAMRCYILPLGMWHLWTMFAPDPAGNSVTLEADVVDRHGLRSRFAFPRLADYSWWRGIPRFRHAKYAANLGDPEADSVRRLAAKHAVRQLVIPAASFPVDVHLMLQIQRCPPAGGPPADAMTPAVPNVLTTFHFASLSEVTP
jgi:hypothetical protein